MADRQYQYNSASQISQIVEPAITKNYGYDAIDRLASANYSNPLQQNESYSYDGVGNRTASQLSASYSYQRFNRLTNTSTATYSHDTNGNLISKTDSNGTTQYTWNFENRLKQVTLPSGTTVSYKYDALGRRIQRIPSTGVSTNFVYDGQDVVKDLNSDGSTVDYLNGPGIDNKLRLTDSRLIATGPLYFLQDQLGSTTALTNSLGAAVSQLTYDAFGNSSGSSLTRYDYTGREHDPDTGMLYYRARFYDPTLGRFLSEDKIGFRGTDLNAYPYVGSNPVNEDDPLGLQGRPRRGSDKVIPPGWTTPLSGDQQAQADKAYEIAKQRLECDQKCRDAVMKGLAGDPISMLSNIKNRGNMLYGGEVLRAPGETTAQVYGPTLGMGSAAIIILYNPFFGDNVFGLTIKPIPGTLPGFDASYSRALILLHELRHAVTGHVHPKDGTGDVWNKEIFEACFRDIYDKGETWSGP